MKLTLKGIGLGLVGWAWWYWRIQNQIRRMNEMENDVKLGELGDLDLKLENGKASVTLKVSKEIPGAALKSKAEVSIEMDASALLDKLFAAIEAKSPAGAVVIEEGVKMILKAAVEKI